MSYKSMSVIPLSQTMDLNNSCQFSLQNWIDNRVGLQTYPDGLDLRIRPVKKDVVATGKFYPYSTGKRHWLFSFDEPVNYALDWQIKGFHVTDFVLYLPDGEQATQDSYLQLIVNVNLMADRLRPD